jgi:predicted RNase H-like HicB family nuclease
MQSLRVPIRVVFYRDEDAWIAHCLEFDLLGDGETQEQALEMLSDAIRIQVEATVDFGNPANLFSPADGRFFRMFAAGEDVTALGITLELGSLNEIIIEHVELRQFVEPEPAAL